MKLEYQTAALTAYSIKSQGHIYKNFHLSYIKNQFHKKEKQHFFKLYVLSFGSSTSITAKNGQNFLRTVVKWRVRQELQFQKKKCKQTKINISLELI